MKKTIRQIKNVIVINLKYYRVKGTKIPNSEKYFIDNYYKVTDSNHHKIFFVREKYTR